MRTLGSWRALVALIGGTALVLACATGAAGQKVTASPQPIALAEAQTVVLELRLSQPILAPNPTPDTGVTVHLTPSDASRLQLTPSEVTWLAADWWQARQVQVLAVSNTIVDATGPLTISATVTTDAPFYQGVAFTITVTIAEDDVAPPSTVPTTTIATTTTRPAPPSTTTAVVVAAPEIVAEPEPEHAAEAEQERPSRSARPTATVATPAEAPAPTTTDGAPSTTSTTTTGPPTSTVVIEVPGAPAAARLASGDERDGDPATPLLVTTGALGIGTAGWFLVSMRRRRDAEALSRRDPAD